MRTILALIAIFSCNALFAQPLTSEGCEPTRSELLAYPTAEEATKANGGNNRYYTLLNEWTHQENSLSTPFTVPFAWANRQVFFCVESLGSAYEVWVNGEQVAYNADGNNPCEVNITRHVKEGRNMVELRPTDPSPLSPIESWKQEEKIALGKCYLVSQPTMRVRDVFVECTPPAEEGGNITATVSVVVKSHALNPRTSRIHYELLTPTGELAGSGYQDLTLDMRREDTVRFLASVPKVLQWSDKLPTLYTLRLKTQHEGRYGEYMELQLGFRSVEVKEGKLVVNGIPTLLRAYDVTGSTASSNLLARLRELGYNALRFSAGPVPASLLKLCDIMGIYLIVQAPIDSSKCGTSRERGGNPSNDPAWLPHYLQRTENTYHATKRYASVVAFSLARNSANGINLYESYLNLKRFGDPRPIIYPEAAGEWNNDPLKVR